MSVVFFDELFDAARELTEATPALREFAPWPDDASFSEKQPNLVPAASLVENWDAGKSSASTRFLQAVKKVAPIANWQQTYSQDEVGADFLARYGYFELFGPTGHFHTEKARGFIGYWGEGLYYPWHVHEAEELYFVVAGEGLFEAEGTEAKALGPGGSARHESFQPHALTMNNGPLLTFVLWRGSGLAKKARMGTA